MTMANSPKLTTDADRTIGGLVASLRKAQGLSQTALGHALGVSFQQVQKYEKGRNRIGAGRLQAIADVLHVPVETFFVNPSSAGDAEARTFFEDPQVMELVMAFTGIADATTRASVLSIVKMASTLQNGRDDSPPVTNPQA